MKKAKLMLTAIAVLAVVGGALAFRAHALTAPIYCTDNAALACSVEVVNSTIIPPVGADPAAVSFCTDAAHSAAACIQTNVYDGE